jgi:hypothetical protein
MENNFECSEGVVGQASTETLSGTATTSTIVDTLLFGQWQRGWNGDSMTPVTIATQWGQAFASVHIIWCAGHAAQWEMDPWSKRPVLRPDVGSCR